MLTNYWMTSPGYGEAKVLGYNQGGGTTRSKVVPVLFKLPVPNGTHSTSTYTVCWSLPKIYKQRFPRTVFHSKNNSKSTGLSVQARPRKASIWSVFTGKMEA